VHLKFAAISRKHATLAVQESGSVRARRASFPSPLSAARSRRDPTRRRDRLRRL